MFAMRDQLLDCEDPEMQELLLKVLVQQQRIMEELCHQVSAAQLATQGLSGNTHTGSSEFLDTPGSALYSSRLHPGENEGKSSTTEIRRPQVVVLAGQPEQQQHPLNPSGDIDGKMADRWEFDIDQTVNNLDQSPCTSISHVSGVIPEHDQLVITKLDGRSGSCQSDDNLVDEHTQHNPQSTHPEKNFAPAGNSVAVLQSSHGKQDVINQSLDHNPITSGSFRQFLGDQREQAYESSTGGEALCANHVNSSADVVSVLDNRANRCAGVQINNFPDRLLHNGSELEVVIFTEKPLQSIEVVINPSCIKVRNTNSSPQHVGHRTPPFKYADVFIRRMGLCITTKVKLSHAAVFQPGRPDICSMKSAAGKEFSLQQGLETLQYKPWDPGV